MLPSILIPDIMRAFHLSLHLAAFVSRALGGSLDAIRPRWYVGQTVCTSREEIIGYPAVDASDVSQYLGIPDGEPPVSRLRFSPPTAYAGRTQIVATKFVSFHAFSSRLATLANFCPLHGPTCPTVL